jgi:hypothetical protein
LLVEEVARTSYGSEFSASSFRFFALPARWRRTPLFIHRFQRGRATKAAGDAGTSDPRTIYAIGNIHPKRMHKAICTEAFSLVPGSKTGIRRQVSAIKPIAPSGGLEGAIPKRFISTCIVAPSPQK